MNVWKLATGVTLLLIVGILIGSVGTGFFLKERRGAPPSPPMEPGSRTAAIVERLSRDLDLTETQRKAIETIVSHTEERLHERFIRERREIDKIIGDSFEQMKRELNETQRKKLDAAKKRFRRNRPPMDRPGGPHGPPPPPPGPPPGPPPDGPGGPGVPLDPGPGDGR